MPSLAEQIASVPGEPSSVRVGMIESAAPAVLSVQGALFSGDAVGVLGSYAPVAGDTVAVLGQSKTAASDPSTWLILGKINTSAFVAALVPQVKAWHSTLVNMANDTATVINLQTELWDTASMHDNVVNPSRLTAPTSGRYLILASIGFAANGVGRRICQIRANGVTLVAEHATAAAQTGSPVVTVASEYDLVAGQYVEMLGLQTSGGALNSAAVQHQSWMSMRRMGDIVGI